MFKKRNMKRIALYIIVLVTAAGFWGCQKDNTYPGGKVGAHIALFDVRSMYRGKDVTLTTENMFGADQLRCIVISDHREGNMPEGMLIVQDSNRLAQRGIAIPIGTAAAQYEAGDSVTIHIAGATLTRKNGIHQLVGVNPAGIKVLSKGNRLPTHVVALNKILDKPEVYESTMAIVVKGGFDPLPGPGDVLSGDKMLSDGYGDVSLHTNANAAFANMAMPVMANYRSIVGMKQGPDDTWVPELRVASTSDIVLLSSVVEIAPIVISGFLTDPPGTEGNYEYIQLLATQDIDFSVTPFSVVTTNNAGASTPGGLPVNGWATGGLRSYKFNLTSGTVAKGEYFYVGGTARRIFGSGSTSMSTSKWIRAYNYSTTDGEGFGGKTGNLLANSGNASGMAVFEGTAVTIDSRPVDVVMVGLNGVILSEGANPVGYRITNTDWYDVIHPLSQKLQPFFRSGNNTIGVAYAAAVFFKLGGIYNPALGRWRKARSQVNVKMAADSQVSEIEGEGATTLR